MSRRFRLIVVALVLATGAAAGLYLHTPVSAQEQVQPKIKVLQAVPKKQEYRIVVVRFDAEETGEKALNKLAEEGFEVAFVTGGQLSSTMGRGASGTSPVFHYTLRRAK